jgi:hypothetical protein
VRAALNRPDLPTLLNVPGAHVSVAESAGGTFTAADGTKQTDAAAEVQIGDYDVRLTDNENMSVARLKDTAAADRDVDGVPAGHGAVSA